MNITIPRLPNGELVGRFKVAGIEWVTRPAKTAEAIYSAAKKLEDQYNKLVNDKAKKRGMV